MITELRLSNFKAWGRPTIVPLAPITLLLGRNSAGKTSLIQSLLLMKQSAEAPDSGRPLRFGGESGNHVSLGGYRDVVHQHSRLRRLALGVSIVPGSNPRRRSRSRELRFDGTYTCDPEGDGALLESLQYRLGDKAFRFSLAAEGWRAQLVPEGGRRASRSIRLPGGLKPAFGFSIPTEALRRSGDQSNWVKAASETLIRELRNLEYLGPLRKAPSRHVHSDGTRPTRVGAMGDHAYHYLLEGIDATRGHLASSMRNSTKWLRKLGMIDEADDLCSVREAAGIHELHLHRGGDHSDDKSYVALADLGFGVSQVLPIVVLAEFLEEGRTALIEQPEIHLHPAAQSSLADMFVEAATKRGVQFIVETHSEHLFRRIQTLVAEEKLTPALCKAYFVERSPTGSAISELEVDAYGHITNWPPQFFGDAIGESERQMMAALKRQAKLEARHA